MKHDAGVQDDVIKELKWDPEVSDPDKIAVSVSDGAVTLTGHATTYAEKMAASKAAERIYGVTTVANDIEVRLTGSVPDDTDIAESIAHILKWNVQIPTGRVQARVTNGWVTLEGNVDHDFQRREVERMVRHVRGVVGVSDRISVKPTASAVEVQGEIEDAFKREAGIEARHVRVQVSDHTAKLYGHVHTVRDAVAARVAAATAPGVDRVESHLVVTP